MSSSSGLEPIGSAGHRPTVHGGGADSSSQKPEATRQARGDHLGLPTDKDNGKHRGKSFSSASTANAPTSTPPTSAVSGVTWDERGQLWRVRVKGPGNPTRQTIKIFISDYGGDVDQARQAAEELAEKIRAGTYKHQPRAPAAHQSEVQGVRWDRTHQLWQVDVKGPGGQVSRRVIFPISQYGGDVDRARKAAEKCARQILAGTYKYRTRAPAVHQSEVPGVTWDRTHQSWQVRIKRPGDPAPQSETFPISEYGGDVDRARKAAEECARQILAGDYVPPPRSKVRRVTWDPINQQWLLQVKNQDPMTFPISEFDGDVDQARNAAEYGARIWR